MARNDRARPSENDPADWRWPDFTPDELRCRGSGEVRMDPGFMDRLQELRSAFGRPMVVNSGYRSPKYNNTVSSTGLNGPHTTGRAVDIRVAGVDAYRLAALAFARGFTGIGFKQHGIWRGRFLHLDTLAGPKRPRLWTYP